MCSTVCNVWPIFGQCIVAHALSPHPSPWDRTSAAQRKHASGESSHMMYIQIGSNLRQRQDNEDRSVQEARSERACTRVQRGALFANGDHPSRAPAFHSSLRGARVMVVNARETYVDIRVQYLSMCVWECECKLWAPDGIRCDTNIQSRAFLHAMQRVTGRCRGLLLR